MSQPSAPPPSHEQLRAALAALEPFGAHPDTGAIHDPIYELLVDPLPGVPNERLLRALHTALDRAPHHPAQAGVRRALGEGFVLPPRTLAQVLTELGPWTCEDPVDEVEHRLRKAASVYRLLQDKTDEQDRTIGQLNRSLNAMAAVAALLALFALAGWLGALDVWQIEWFSPPQPPANLVPPEPPR